MFPPEEPAASAESEPLPVQIGADEQSEESSVDSPQAAKEGRPVEESRVASAEVRIDPELLSGIRDDYSGVRRSEAGAYFEVLSRARNVPAESLERAARTDVGYTLLMADPDRYRGLPITLDGEVRRLVQLASDSSDPGAAPLYEAWLFTRESAANPYRIVATEISPQMPLGESLRRRAQVTGYFFKRQAYDSKGGLHVAPLLLAKSIQSMQPAAGPVVRRDTGLTPYVAGLAVLVALALGLTLWRYRASDRQFVRERKPKLTEVSPEAIEDLNQIETVDPIESLRQLAEEARQVDAKPAK